MRIYLKSSILMVFLLLHGCVPLSDMPRTPQIKELEQKAYAGDLDSQYQLGLQYTINSQSAMDDRRGYDWFLNAAERGHVNAQYMVGMGRLLGRGTESDAKVAVKFFSMAAKLGHVRAQYQLGNAFLNGTGVELDQSWGRQWLEQAGWNGHKEAQFLLAALFSAGIGGQPNLSEAWLWAKKADQSGHDKAKTALETLEEKMSDEQLSVGRKLMHRKPFSDGELYLDPRIRYVQVVLNQQGYQVGIEDGLEGSRTRVAVADYVKRNKLPPETQVLQLINYLRGSF